MTVLRTRLEPPELEAEFRADGLARDRGVTAGLALVTIAFLVLTIPGTWVLSGDPERLHLVWAIRGLDVAAAAAAAYFVRHVVRPRAYDAIVTWWLAIFTIAMVAENALHPAEVTYFVWWDVLIIIVVFAATPLPFARQVALCAAIALGDIVVLWQFKSPAPSFSLSDAILVYACANVVGGVVSTERHRWRRGAFLALRREVEARTELQEALREVKTLQGIIPVCMYCHEVRTEVGAWEQLDQYVRSRTEADFSHGICPRCAAQRFPELEAQLDKLP